MTEEEYIALIISTLGGDTSDGLLANNLPIYWDIHQGIEDDNLRALLTKIDGIDLLLGNSWRNVDFKALDGASVSLSDMFDHLTKLRDLAEQQANALMASLGGVAIGQLTTIAPIMRDNRDQSDPNDRKYRGDPLRRSYGGG